MGYNTPVLFINYNRPHLTRQSFAVIKKLQPKQLYVACDGPRADKPGDMEKTQEVRAIVKQVDWDCEVHYNFSDSNKGCKSGPHTAINWFFGHVEEGVILEDDIIPSPSFFGFAQAMLEMYRYEEKVMHISGNSFLDIPLPNNDSFYFSSIPHVWGWATWRSAWKRYSVDMKSYHDNMQFSHIRSEKIKNYYRRYFKICQSTEIDAWDYQWGYALWYFEGLSITPAVNLIKNIGFGSDATHTKNSTDPLKRMSGGELIPPYLRPSQIQINHDLDEHMFAVHLNKAARKSTLIDRILNKIRSLWR